MNFVHVVSIHECCYGLTNSRGMINVSQTVVGKFMLQCTYFDTSDGWVNILKHLLLYSNVYTCVYIHAHVHVHVHILMG